MQDRKFYCEFSHEGTAFSEQRGSADYVWRFVTKVKLGPRKVASSWNIEVATFQGAVFYCHTMEQLIHSSYNSVQIRKVAAFQGSGLAALQVFATSES